MKRGTYGAEPTDREARLEAYFKREFAMSVRIRIFNGSVLVARVDGEDVSAEEMRKLRVLGESDGVKFKEVLRVPRCSATRVNASEDFLMSAAIFYPDEVRANLTAQLYALANPAAWAWVFG